MTEQEGGAWRSRIVDHGEEDPTQLLANPKNWRDHPGRQRDALRSALSQVGWVQSIIVNRVTGHVVDGHARIEEAISRGEPTVPVVYVELTPDEEDLVLASFDPLGAWAVTNHTRLSELLAEITVTDEALARLLGDVTDDGHDLTHEERMREWQGMPEFAQDDLMGVRRIIVNFKTEEDVRDFEEKIGQSLGSKRSVWHPEVPYTEVRSSRYVTEEAAG